MSITYYAGDIKKNLDREFRLSAMEKRLGKLTSLQREHAKALSALEAFYRSQGREIAGLKRTFKRLTKPSRLGPGTETASF